MKKQALLSLSLIPLLAAGMAAHAGDTEIKNTIKNINPNASVSAIEDSPVDGLKTVVADSTVLYTSEDGRYLFYGVLLDTKTQRNLTDDRLSRVRGAVLKSIPDNVKVVYSPADPKYTVTVFTDVSCPYCHSLHKEMQGYMDAGIRVEYVPWPRGGTRSPVFRTMQSAWCASDRKAAIKSAFERGPVAPATCEAGNELASIYTLGLKLGIEGTPAVFSQDGQKLGGFLTPEKLLAKLKRNAAK